MMWRNRYTRRYAPQTPFGMWRDMNNFHRNMEFIFGGTRGPVRSSYPLINAWSGDEGVKVTAELPGVLPEDIEITVDSDTLTISGNRSSEELPDDAKLVRRERRLGEFSRSIELPFHADADNISAQFTNGVLEINIPRLPEEKPKKISVQSS